MPTIKLDILARIHEAQLRKTEREAKERFEKLGRQAGEDLARGIEDKAPKIRSAMNSAADAALNLTRKTRELGKASTELNDIRAKQLKLEQQIADGKSRGNRLLRTEADLEGALASARKQHRSANRELLAQEGEIDEMRRKHNATISDLAQRESVLKDIRLKGRAAATEANEYEKRLQPLRKQSKKEAAELRDAEWILGQTRDQVATASASMKTFTKELDEARRNLKTSTKELADAEVELQRAKESSSKVDADIKRMHEEVEKATRKRQAAVRSLAEAEVDEENKRAKREQKRNNGRRGGGGRGSTVGNILTDLPFVPSGPAGAAIGGAVLVGAASAAEALVTASQSLLLLPAVGVAAAAGIGTLALGFSGLSDAIDHMSDPKQFAEALQTISPAAQQVALEIKYLVDGPLKDLKQSTQEALFNGVPEQLHNLTNTLLPQIQQLTNGVAGSFNNMFMNATNQLMTPETMGSLQVTIDNIVKAFQNLEPAVAPFVSAIAKLVETGSTFLPGLATSLTNAAITFNNWVTKIQQDGSLKEWIQKGIDAAGTIISVIGDLGRRIFETFGNKSPEEFRANLDAMITTAIGVAQAVAGIADVVNGLLGVINPVVEAMGGWRTVAAGMAAIFIGWKTGGAAKAIMDVVGLLGEGSAGSVGMGGALRALPGLAGAAASGIAGAFAAIAIPMAFITAMNEFAKANPGVLENSAEGQKGRGQQAIADRLGQQFNPSPDAGGLPGAQNERRGGARGNIVNGREVPSWTAPPAAGTPGATAGTPFAKAGLPGYTPFDVPTVESTESKSKQLADMRASLNPADFAVDPFAGMPGGNPGLGAANASSPIGGGGGGAGGTSYGPLEVGTNGKPFQKPGLGYQSVNDDAVIRAQNTLIRDGWALTNANLDLEALKRTGLGTQQELLDAEHKVQDKWMDIQEHRAALTKAEEGTWNKIAADKNMFADVLDKDFGVSKGLPGIAENMVRYLGTLATAGFRGQLKAIEASDPEWQARLAASKSGVSGSTLLGQTLPGTAGQTVNGMPVTAGAQASSISYAGGFPSILQDTGSVKSGPQSQQAAAAVQQLFGSQIRGKIGGSRDNNTAKGTHDAGLSIDIPIGPDQMDLGDQIRDYLQTNAQALGLKYTIWRDEGRYPNGATGKPGFHTPGHQNHIDAHFNGQGGTGAPLSGTPLDSGSLAAGLSSPIPSGATPVFVVNMPGAGGLGGSGFPTGTFASGQGNGAPPGPSTGANADTGSFWDAVMPHEGGTWDNQDTGKNGHYGGLQFAPETWRDFGGVDLTGQTNPGLATREQQIEIANRTAWQGYNGKSPQGLSAWEAITDGKVPGITANTPMPTGGLGDPADLFMGGGGEGPIFKKPPGPPGMPGPMPFAPGDVGAGNVNRDGLQVVSNGTNPTQYRTANGPIPLPGPGANNPMAALDPTSPVGVTGGPAGTVGPFPAPPGVAAAAAPPAPNPTAAPAAPPPAPAPAWQPAATPNQGIGAAAGAAAAMAFPGAGEAAAKAGQLIDRGVKFGGQLAGIGISGLQETFGLSDPSGGGSLQSGWIGRLASGLAQVKPATPTTAGQTKAPDVAPQEHQGSGAAPGPNYSGVVIQGDFVQSPDRKNGQQVMNDLALQSHASKGSP